MLTEISMKTWTWRPAGEMGGGAGHPGHPGEKKKWRREGEAAEMGAGVEKVGNYSVDHVCVPSRPIAA